MARYPLAKPSIKAKRPAQETTQNQVSGVNSDPVTASAPGVEGRFSVYRNQDGPYPLTIRQKRKDIASGPNADVIAMTRVGGTNGGDVRVSSLSINRESIRLTSLTGGIVHGF